MSDARDPYLGLNNHIRQQAREQAPTYYAIGKILSLRPLKIRADGLDLDRDDLRVPESMYSNFIQAKPVEGRGVRTRLPMKEFVCKCALSIGVATRPEEYVYGATILQVDDEVLLMRSSDGQSLLPSREDGGAAVSLFPLISEPDTGELTGSDGLPLYREVDWDFRTNKPVWKGGNPVYVTGDAPFWCGRGMRCTPCASTTTCSAPTTALTEIPCWGRHIPERCGNLRPSALYGKRCRSIRISRTSRR